jgi:mRNA interferase MazF
MTPTTAYSFGDIVLVPFAFTDQSAAKKRPAVVVSSEAYNQKRPDIIIMAVTSQMSAAAYYGDIAINEWQPAGLLKPSVIKPVVATIEKSLVIKKLGRLKQQDRSLLRQSFDKIFGQE